MDQLTKQELNTLMEALQAWEDKDQTADLVDSLFEKSAVFGMGRIVETKQRQRAIERKNRKEISVLLQAKLIGIRTAMETAPMPRSDNTSRSDEAFREPLKSAEPGPMEVQPLPAN